MKNISLKYAKESGFSAIRIQELLDEQRFPDGEFDNPEDKELYLQAKYYHKDEHGLIRMSKYNFSETTSIKRSCLKKNNISLELSEDNYNYGISEQETPSVKSWYICSSSHKAFNEWGSDSISMEAIMLQKMPLLHKASTFLWDNFQPTLSYKNKNDIYMPSPILYEGVPLWLSPAAGKNKIVTWEQKTNIAAMMAPRGNGGTYTQGQILYLLMTLFAAFGGIVRRGTKDRIPYSEIHTGNWGCGSMRNNKELIYLSQLYAADVMGVNKIVFHKIDKKFMESAVQKYKALPDNLSFIEAVNSFKDYGFNWPT